MQNRRGDEAKMAALQPYQRVLLENRDILLSDLKTDDVIPLLYLSKVLSQKEVDDIEIGRTWRERIESLLDVLHYKGERGYSEFCRALEERYPQLAAKLSNKEPQVEQTERSYDNRGSKSRYYNSYPDKDSGHREVNGVENENFRRSSERIEEQRSMRGDGEYRYAQPEKRHRDGDKDRDSPYTRRRHEGERSFSSHQGRERESDRHSKSSHDSERPLSRKSMDAVNPAEQYIWERQTIVLEKANANQGFGIAVSGGVDNPHYKSGDTSIVVSDIVEGSPADGILKVNDVIVQVNDVNVENVQHGDAVQALKDSGYSARLIIRRRKAMPSLPKKDAPQTLNITLRREKGKGYGFSLANRLYIKDIDPRGIAFHEGEMDPGDIVLKINDKKPEELRLREAIDLVRNSNQLDLVILKSKLEPLSLSTRSLPSAFRSRGFKPITNGIHDDKAPDLPASERGSEQPPEKRRRSLDGPPDRASSERGGERPYETRYKPEDRLPERTPSERGGERPYETRRKSEERPPERTQSERGGERPYETRPKPEERLPERTPSERGGERPYETRPKPEERLPERTPSERVVERPYETRYKPDDRPSERTPSDKVAEQPVTKQEVKPEERGPDLPPSRRYSDSEAPMPDRPRWTAPPDEEDKVPFGGSSWKRLEPERPRTPEREEEIRVTESDRPEHMPKPADVTRTDGTMDLSRDSWDAASPAVRPYRQDSSASTPRSQRKENRFYDYLDDRNTRQITFRKEGSLGIQVQGGNKSGIFVSGVRDGNPAHRQGLRRGDQILMANDIDFKDITREEAVLILLSLGDEVSLLSQPKMQVFDRIKNSPGDSFYIKVHFNYELMKEEELSFLREEVFHVWDTMYNGVIGAWHAQRVTLKNDETDTGVIPNKCRAEQLATVRRVEEDKTPQKSHGTGSLKRRDSRGGTLKKNYMFVSTDKLDKDSFVSTAREFKLSAYERVILKQPGFVRPVVLLGPIADITIDKLLQDLPQHFGVPTAFGGRTPTGRASPNKATRRTLSFSSIKAVIDSGRHCLLDISPDEVERLNYCQLYPIVIFLRPPNKTVVKEMRAQHGAVKESAKHIKKLYDNSVKLEQFYFNMFTATIATGATDEWYGRVKSEIKKQQDNRVWMSEDKFEEHEGLEFSMPNRYSTAYDYDSNLDSPTGRSSVSHPADEEIVAVAEPVRDVESTPNRPFAEPYTSYNGPEVEYRRDPYDDELGRYDNDIETASKPGYKPSGNIVKVLPSSMEPGNLRQSLKKTRPTSEDFSDKPPPDDRDGEGIFSRDDLRKTDFGPRYNGIDTTDEELRNKANALRKVEPPSDLLRGYDDRVGVKVSDLWAIDNEARRDRIQPREVAQVESRPDDIERRLEELESSVPPPKPTEVKQIPQAYRFEPKARNVVVDYRGSDRPETIAHTSYYPTRSYATVRRVETHPTEPEISAQVVDRAESTPSFPDDRYNRSLPRDFGRDRPDVPKEVYRAEVTIPTRVDSKQDRPQSGYGYSSQAYAPKPFGSDQPPPRPAEPANYNFKLSRPRPDSPKIRRDPEPRPGTYRSEYRPKVTDLDKVTSYSRDDPHRDDPHRDDPQVVTSDFESLDDDTQVVATARGTFTSKGGVLASPESGVSIYIPEGAIPEGIDQEIYFKVCKDNNIMPPLDAEKGETLLSPLVMCGPHGTQFLKPVELRLPHCAAMTPDGWSFALKSSDTPTGMPTQWRNVSLPGQENKDKCQVDPNSVSVLVDHFSSFSLVGEARHRPSKRMLAGVFAAPPEANSDWSFRVVLADDTKSAFKDMTQSEISCGRYPFSSFVPINVHGDAKDIRVQLRDIGDGWWARSACKKYIEFQNSWNAYRGTPSVDFVVRDRAWGRMPDVCGVEVWQEGHERESVILEVCTRKQKEGRSKSRTLQEYLM